MVWNDGLLEEQSEAAKHLGCHSCLLAGPGTGKTLTLQRHVVYLIQEKGIHADQILALTFTRAASFELRKRIAEILGETQAIPKVMTLHSFALRQLLKNTDSVDTIPNPLRIADDWEEENIIVQDLKNQLGYKVKDIKNRFSLLSADWQQLAADSDTWEHQFSDPRFLGAWRQHRTVYGYTLRDELVYQLKRSLEQTSHFILESDFLHLLVDEYQDLNRCDMAVIFELKNRNIETFAAGDDDQSIYGFRYAYPEGIRQFQDDFKPSEILKLKTCIRCDKNIIKLAKFVADLDPKRLVKPLEPRKDAGEGAVHILKFENQDAEAQGIAEYCKYLIRTKGLKPNEIMILLRNDRHSIFSATIRDSLIRIDIPTAIPDNNFIFDSKDGRIFLSICNLLENERDSLALRSLLTIKDNGIGPGAISKIFSLALSSNSTFYDTACRICSNPELIQRDGTRIAAALGEIFATLDKYIERFQPIDESSEKSDIIRLLTEITNDIFTDPEEKKKVIEYINLIINESDPGDYGHISRVLGNSLTNIEQELDPDKVNIMTMHKAKGLTATAVIIAACEDEYIPGRQIGESEQGDERRLLYVSLSRAKKYLTITYCDLRTGAQSHTGKNPDNPRRTLSRFLRDSPNRPISGSKYLGQIRNIQH